MVFDLAWVFLILGKSRSGFVDPVEHRITRSQAPVYYNEDCEKSFGRDTAECSCYHCCSDAIMDDDSVLTNHDKWMDVYEEAGVFHKLGEDYTCARQKWINFYDFFAEINDDDDDDMELTNKPYKKFSYEALFDSDDSDDDDSIAEYNGETFVIKKMG